MNTQSESTGEPKMGRLKWREALNPGGRYDRGQFLFWFAIPIIFIILIVTNTWGLEKLLIKLTYFIGLHGINFSLVATVLSIVAAVFLACLSGLALIKRYRDLGRSVWWVLFVFVPFLNVLFLVYMLVWPGKVRSDESGIKKLTIINWLGLGVTVAVLSLVIMGLLAAFQFVSTDNKGVPLRVWNRTGQLLNVQIITSDGVVHRGYNAGEVSPGEIIRNEDILPGRSGYTVKTMNARGDEIYSRDFTPAELAGTDWIVVIPPTPANVTVKGVTPKPSSPLNVLQVPINSSEYVFIEHLVSISGEPVEGKYPFMSIDFPLYFFFEKTGSLDVKRLKIEINDSLKAVYGSGMKLGGCAGSGMSSNAYGVYDFPYERGGLTILEIEDNGTAHIYYRELSIVLKSGEKWSRVSSVIDTKVDSGVTTKAKLTTTDTIMNYGILDKSKMVTK